MVLLRVGVRKKSGNLWSFTKPSRCGLFHGPFTCPCPLRALQLKPDEGSMRFCNMTSLLPCSRINQHRCAQGKNPNCSTAQKAGPPGDRASEIKKMSKSHFFKINLNLNRSSLCYDVDIFRLKNLFSHNRT